MAKQEDTESASATFKQIDFESHRRGWTAQKTLAAQTLVAVRNQDREWLSTGQKLLHEMTVTEIIDFVDRHLP
jgi:hypothetical protein